MDLSSASGIGIESALKDAELAASKHVMRFNWEAVSVRVLRELLAVAYKERPDEAGKLKEQAAPRLAQLAHSIYGTPPKKMLLDRYPDSWGVMQHTWAGREADREQLGQLIAWASLGVPVADRNTALYTLKGLRDSVAKQKKTVNFKANLRKFFILWHKTPQPVKSRSGFWKPSDALMGVLLLSGKGVQRDHVPYPHKRDAEQALDRLVAQEPDNRRGLVILPTGAGKTSTVIDWAVPRLAEDKSVRILWLAHQEELLLQAERAFKSASAREAVGFERRLRIISSGHSAASTLVEQNLDVALITWQTLYKNFDVQNQSRLKKFLARPTIIVIDEAHRAAAPGYQKILNLVKSSPHVAVVGLTATPWPGQYGAAARLTASFPTVVINKTLQEMYEHKILAVPVYHTVETGEVLTLTPDEKKQARGDLPASVLERLATARRDAVLLEEWTSRSTEWGKTLVFATARKHADRLGYLFEDAGVPVKVLHSSSPETADEVLRWFRATRGPVVLVSVGMLTEGVDLPDAQTAFLARPTTSRILLRQMIGRVLRGEQAGGSATANVVYFRDVWAGFDEIIGLEDVYEPGGKVELRGAPKDGRPIRRLPPVVDDATGIPIGEGILAQVHRMYSQQSTTIPIDPAMTKTELVGYYELLDQNVPVMSHQVEGYRQLITKTHRGDSFQGSPAMSLFDTDHPPYPTPRMVNGMIDHIRMFNEDPARLFHPLRAGVSPLEVAKELRKAPGMTIGEQEEWLRARFESSLARLAYPTLQHFMEAVQNDLRGSSQQHTVERIDEFKTDDELPLLARSTRKLPALKMVTSQMRKHFVGEAIVGRIDEANLPDLAWTAGPRKDAWAFWSLKGTGQNKGKATIRVNRGLQAAKKHVPDQLLEFLVVHEMLHHLLPGQGHDAEFHRLEASWPRADEINLALDTLLEKFRLV